MKKFIYLLCLVWMTGQSTLLAQTEGDSLRPRKLATINVSPSDFNRTLQGEKIQNLNDLLQLGAEIRLGKKNGDTTCGPNGCITRWDAQKVEIWLKPRKLEPKWAPQKPVDLVFLPPIYRRDTLMRPIDFRPRIFTIVPEKKPKLRIHFYARETAYFMPGRSRINKSFGTTTSMGLATVPGRRWYAELGLGHFPRYDFETPPELAQNTTIPEPRAGWNACSCDEATPVISVHAMAKYSLPFAEIAGGQVGTSVAVTIDEPISSDPVPDLLSRQWTLPLAVAARPSVYYTRRMDKNNATLTLSLGLPIQARKGANHFGPDFSIDYVIPLKKGTQKRVLNTPVEKGPKGARSSGKPGILKKAWRGTRNWFQTHKWERSRRLPKPDPGIIG